MLKTAKYSGLVFGCWSPVTVSDALVAVSGVEQSEAGILPHLATAVKMGLDRAYGNFILLSREQRQLITQRASEG